MVYKKLEKLKRLKVTTWKHGLQVLGVFVLLFVLAGLYLFNSHRHMESFADSYDKYIVLAERREASAYLPGISANALRAELDQALSGALTENMDRNERLKISKQGIKLIKDLETQIDEIGETGALVEEAIADMEESANGTSGANKKTADQIVEMARDKFNIVSDIRGLSYRANFHTSQIFERIIKDDGRLTDAHIILLNEQIPEAEKQFDKRSRLYDELRNISIRLADIRF